MDSRRRILYLTELNGTAGGPLHMDAIVKVGLYCLTGRIEAPPRFLYPYVTPSETPGIFIINGEILMTVYGNIEMEYTNTETEEPVSGRIVWQEIDVEGRGEPVRDFGDFVTYKRRAKAVGNAISWGKWRNPMSDAIDKNNLHMFGLPSIEKLPKTYDAAEGKLLSDSKGFAVHTDFGPSSERVEDGVLTMKAKNLIVFPRHQDWPGHNEAIEVEIDEANEGYINIVLTNEPDQENAGEGYVRCQFTPGASGKYTLRGSAMGTGQSVEHSFTGLTYPAVFRVERRGEAAKVYMNGAMLADTAGAVTEEEPDELFMEGYYYWWHNMLTFGEDAIALRRIAYERLGDEI